MIELRTPLRRVAALLIVVLLAGLASAPPAEAAHTRKATARNQAAVPEPDGYRMGAYRAPVPATLAGGTVVTLEQVEKMIASGEVIAIDVLPRPPRPKGLPEGTIWRPRPRYNIPGSVWLPNIGFGALPTQTERYFRDNLASLTGGDKTRKILIYCLADCWMSWNATKRAISYGYTSVYWFPEGTDAWTARDLPTEQSEPVPGWAPE